MQILNPTMMARALAGALLSAAAAAGAIADDVTLGDLTIDHPWSPPPLAGRVESAAYFTIRNAGEADRLIAARAAIAESAELHAHVMTGDVMRMEKVEAVDVPAGGETVFAPGGHHVMLFGLEEALAPGATFPMTLTFENAGEIEVTVGIETMAENLARPSPDAAAADHSGH